MGPCRSGTEGYSKSVEIERLDVLQWGRAEAARKAAESPAVARQPGSASMGPCRSGTEGAANSSPPAAENHASMGPSRSGTEGGKHYLGVNAQSSFNGAVPKRHGR